MLGLAITGAALKVGSMSFSLLGDRMKSLPRLNVPPTLFFTQPEHVSQHL